MVVWSQLLSHFVINGSYLDALSTLLCGLVQVTIPAHVASGLKPRSTLTDHPRSCGSEPRIRLQLYVPSILPCQQRDVGTLTSIQQYVPYHRFSALVHASQQGSVNQTVAYVTRIDGDLCLSLAFVNFHKRKGWTQTQPLLDI